MSAFIWRFSGFAAKSFNEVIAVSGCTYWRLSLIARSNNDKLINQIFTREIIEASHKDDIADLFPFIQYRWQNYIKRMIISKKYFISVKNIFRHIIKTCDFYAG